MFLKRFFLKFDILHEVGFSTVITIILVPKLQPTVSEYIRSDFINNVGLGVVIFILTLFFNSNRKALSRAVTDYVVGSIDKSFKLIFAFKGYIAQWLFSIIITLSHQISISKEDALLNSINC